MSRSYQKFNSRRTPEYKRWSWGPPRLQERLCIQKEMCAMDCGDIVFPRIRSVQGGRLLYRYYLSREDVRKEIFQEIGYILNGYTGVSNNRNRRIVISIMKKPFSKISPELGTAKNRIRRIPIFLLTGLKTRMSKRLLKTGAAIRWMSFII